MIEKERMLFTQNLVLELMKKYRSEYASFKSRNAPAFTESFWCKGWREAYAPDYISEISDNTQEARKILPKEPRKKAYTSLHCYSGKKPIKSLFYGNDGNLCMEKFFVEADNRIIGVCYTTNDGKLYNLSIETRNEDGLPEAYTMCCMDMHSKYDACPQYLLRSVEYHFDAYSHIVSASYADRLKLNPDDKNACKNAVPEYLEDYRFLYENGTVTHFTRINYSASFEKKTEHTWKFDRWILK